jgi:hypothetical protein
VEVALPALLCRHNVEPGLSLGRGDGDGHLPERRRSGHLDVRVFEQLQVQENGGRTWMWRSTATEAMESNVESLGYCQPGAVQMPVAGVVNSVSTTDVSRPDFSLRGVGDDQEIRLPSDILDLWRMFGALPQDKRQQFLGVGTVWQVSTLLGRRYPTAAFTWLVATCEALKPPDHQFRDHNVFHIVESLLGRARVDEVRRWRFRPDAIRGRHIHTGQFFGSEFVPQPIAMPFHDPTFDEEWGSLRRITQACIVEWLRVGGDIKLQKLTQSRTWRRKVKDNAMMLLAISAIAASEGGSSRGGGF